MIPTSAHNEALAGDVLYSAFLNYEWRQIVLPFIVAGMAQIAATIEVEADRQDFEVLYGAMIDDFYNEDVMDNTPVGSIVAYADYTAPAKWLKCEGQLVNQADYPELYTLIGNRFYASPPGGQFGLPDLRERFVRGQDTNAGSNDIGNVAGNSTHTLDISELPAHDHTFVKGTGGTGSVVASSAEGRNTSGTPQTTSSVGSGAAFDIMNPYMRMAFIIKVLP